MSLSDLQDVCIAIGSIATLDLPMVVDLIGIYGLKGPYCTLTTTDWFLQALSVIPRGSWGDVARRFIMIRWASPMYDGAVIERFAHAKVIAGTIVSFVANRKMVITKDVFAEAFGLTTEGMVGFIDIPAKSVAKMRMRFSGTDFPFRASNKKKEMKVEYRLLHEIVAKALCTKAGSFDVVTSEKFDLMVAISAGLKMNWGYFLFQTLVAMVYTPNKQSQGFAVQMSVLLEKLVKTDLGESVKLHPQKVLNNRSVPTYTKKNPAVVPDGESSKASGDTAGEKSKIVGPSGEIKKSEEVVEKKKLMIPYIADRVDSEEEDDFAQTGPQPINFSNPQDVCDAVNELEEVQRVVVSMDSKVVSLDSKVDKLMGTHIYMKHDSGSGNLTNLVKGKPARKNRNRLKLHQSRRQRIQTEQLEQFVLEQLRKQLRAKCYIRPVGRPAWTNQLGAELFYIRYLVTDVSEQRLLSGLEQNKDKSRSIQSRLESISLDQIRAVQRTDQIGKPVE
ncbi:hypothetical protein F511_23448 [Dorcoceras hygrometricum]|uniref:Uncharacterized protein n=1 Tax=Dorcoceras hygrometricum TaxID=472368 RepID=A0A2Z7CQF6_9LAMI|nr:hypothetical protein F511_23448 [Dorcoceras hygrometricum]